MSSISGLLVRLCLKLRYEPARATKAVLGVEEQAETTAGCNVETASRAAASLGLAVTSSTSTDMASSVHTQYTCFAASGRLSDVRTHAASIVYRRGNARRPATGLGEGTVATATYAAIPPTGIAVSGGQSVPA